MPSFVVVYYAGLVPAALLMTARAMWLANRHEHVTRPVAVALGLFAAITWPISFPIGAVIKLSEWLHLDGWIDAYISWLERLARRRGG